MATVAPFCQAMISSMSIILLRITRGTQFTSQTLMWATMGARKQDQLEANLKLTLMSIWSLFILDTNTSTCGLPSIDSWRPDIHVSASRVSLLQPIHGEDTWLMAHRSLGDGRIPHDYRNITK